MFQRVESLRRHAFTTQLRRLGRTELQAGGEFVGRDARVEFGVSRAFGGVSAVERLEVIPVAPLRVAAQVCELSRRKQVCDRRPAVVGCDGRGLMDGRQKSCAPVDHAARRQAARVGQHDEGRQVFVLTAEPVGHPCAHRGESGQDESAVGHKHRRPVQRALALHRMDEREVVHALGQLGKQVAHPAAAFAVLAERPPATLAIAGLGREELQLAVGVEGLAVAARELRLVIP